MIPGDVIHNLPVLGADPEIASRIVHVHTVAVRQASWVPLPDDLNPDLVASLAARGVTKLYSHQAKAYELAMRGRDFVIVTPTASGKTLCYNLPVMQTLLAEESARALYLFPTKALSQDQQSELNEVAMGGSLPVKVYTYDGDTPGSLRTAARDTGRIVITNPDMLHTGVLPNHAKWINFFSGLRFVVVDEMHAYRGVFGSHVANVLRRLMRIAAFYGADPCIIFCSATIGNPGELAEALSGRRVDVIEENGAGSGEKTFVFYNPPLVDAVQGIRSGTSTESVKIAIALLKGGIKTILFARSRVQVELIASYISSSLANLYTDNSGIAVSPYRSGLLPSERRAIERGLREGTLNGVVSTNALELGIDIGGLDAAVVAGFPGSMASFWQQTGRAGRRGSQSLAVLVASSSPLDQYIIAHPESFFVKSQETARIDPDNPYIFMDHMKCAAFELPFREGEGLAVGDEACAGEAAAALDYLAEEGIVRNTGGRWYWSAEGYPSEKISLRSATADNVVIVDATGGRRKVIGEMDRASAKELIFDNAIYIHLGRQHIVRKLDIANRVCTVERAEVDYWTDAVVKTDIKMLTEDVSGITPGGAGTILGDVLVRSQAEKFKKLRFHTNENIGYGDIDLPPEEMQTRAIVVTAGGDCPAGGILAGTDKAFSAAVLQGAGRLIHELAPAFLMCDRRDIGFVSRIRDPHFGVPSLYFFDRYPGGTGLAEGLSQLLPRVLSAAADRLRSCPCDSGCPSCIGVDFAAGEMSGHGSTSHAGRIAKKRSLNLLTLLGVGYGGPQVET